ncbi:hypothetical protein Pan216_30480 [Planctomycetes bacterium Pan216]|uniref:Uncharacterized protein n=1 Tax=Kolteria novifilia TaxID=2527975 RepID=A0A518B5C8_9BACT|nr:hypothetical protein Pan216_30480 [Planctomycetes bacterium Pan216]
MEEESDQEPIDVDKMLMFVAAVSDAMGGRPKRPEMESCLGGVVLLVVFTLLLALLGVITYWIES